MDQPVHRLQRSAAKESAWHLKSAESVEYSWIFGEFSAFPRPSGPEQQATASRPLLRKPILRGLAMDLRRPKPANILQRSTPQTSRSFAAYRSSSFRFGWRSLLPTKGMVHGGRTGERADSGRVKPRFDESTYFVCANSCRYHELAALHRDHGSTAKWVRQCWSNLVAYGYHKDMLLDQCLDAAEHLETAGSVGDALNLLERLAPAVGPDHHTDGDRNLVFPSGIRQDSVQLEFHGSSDITAGWAIRRLLGCSFHFRNVCEQGKI